MADIHPFRPRLAEPAPAAPEQDAALIVIAHADGKVSVWSSATTPEQVAWADARLQQAAGQIAREVQEWKTGQE